jgi:hypothetical protein
MGRWIGLVAALVLAVPLAAPAAAPRPHHLQFFVNGKQVPIVPIVGGPDDYAQLHSKQMDVAARWTGDAHGSGTFIRISTSEPDEKVYANCFAGTSCGIPHTLPFALDVETSWYVQLVSTKGHKVLAGYKYCLVRYQ